MVNIVHIGDTVLRQEAHPIAQDELQSTQTKQIISDMKEALTQERFGVAIAAPQIGESVRIFVVAGDVLARINESNEAQLDKAFINPEIIKQSKKTVQGDEGCLSVPGKYGPIVDRAEKITITYFDERGKKHEQGASGFLARIFQHEIDHLNGILFTDIAKKVIEVDDDLKPIN